MYERIYQTICNILGCQFGKAYGSIEELKDKLHRRNIQIKDLKRQLELLKFKTSETNYGEFKNAMEDTGKRKLNSSEKKRLF